MRILSWAALAVLLGAGPARAQPVLTAQGGVLFSSAAVQSVAASTGSYQMFFVRDGWQVLSATSTDLATWREQSGARLATSTVVTAFDASSITSCGLLPSTSSATGFQRLYYVGVSSGGLYSIMSATSTDGRTWGKETGYRIRLTSGTTFLNSPKPVPLSGSGVRLYFVADSSGTNSPANYRVYSASSPDGGLTWSVEGMVIDDRAWAVAPAVLTDGRLRLHYSSYVGGSSTPTVVKSAVSTDGTLLTREPAASLSTTAPSGLWDLAAHRSTETYRWKLWESYTDGVSTAPAVSSATTLTPYPVSVSPGTVLKNAGGTSFTLTGEVLSPGVAIEFVQGAASVAWTGVVGASDLQATGTANLFGKSVGFWDARATNSDTRSGTAANVLLVDVQGGTVSIVDNLFRPAQGGRATISVTVFEAGRLTARLYTVGGALVATLYDGDVAEGGTAFTWNGATAAGGTVASGVYLLRVSGPKTNVTEKIVVIK
ncbi:MAG: hypothetical protein HY553_10685 [Elusimicrobia bacterium]|nr:hypothetical protein [Elusimicrobiota bacterium]